MFYSEKEKQIKKTQNETISSLYKSREYLLDTLKKTQDETIINRINKAIKIMENYTPDFQKYLNNQISDKKRIIWFDMFNKIKTIFRRANKKDLLDLDVKDIEKNISEVIKNTKVTRILQRDLELLEQQTIEYIDKNWWESKIIRKETLETTLTLDYQKHKRWKKRILLDWIQNHLPADSKWKHVYIQFFDEKENVRISLDKAKKTSNKISKIRFVDDGIWYDLKNLLFFFSTKWNEQESAGQFGEGIKMIAAAALREWIDIEFESQNRRAKPTSKKVTYDNTNAKQTYEMQQLCYDVDYLKRTEKFIWARTTFYNPSNEFLNIAKDIGKYVLNFRSWYTPIDKTREWEIVELGGSELYLKWIYINNSDNTYFSYNFYDVELNRDRDKLESTEYYSKIQNIIKWTNSKEVILSLLEREKRKSSRWFQYETSSSLNPQNPKIWKEVFHEKYWDKAVIINRENNQDYRLYNRVKELWYTPILFYNDYFYTTLSNAWINSAIAIYTKHANYEIETSFTLDYMKDQRGIDRIVLDGIQNHLPSDSWWSYVDILIVNNKGEMIPLDKAMDLEYHNIKKIIFKDNGKWYDVNYLWILKSDKEENRKAVWQFGEWLKMLATTCLRNDIGVVFRSRDWEAKANKKWITVDGKSVQKLTFNVSENANKIIWSETEFSNINWVLWDQVKNIYDKVLYFRKWYKCLSEDKTWSQALHYEDGAIFVKDIFLTDKYKDNIIFSYNIKTDLINRDRNHIDRELIRKTIKNIVSTSYSTHMIHTILEKADNNTKSISELKEGWNYFEFQRMNFTFPAMWKQVFYEKFWENAIICDVLGYEKIADVRALWYNPIILEWDISDSLQKIWIPLASTILKENEENFDWISYDELTDGQKEIFQTHTMLDNYLEGNYEVPFRFFKGHKKEYWNRKTLWFWRSSSNYIAFRQEILNDEIRFADTYVHEKAHQITGASDETREHFDYVCKSYVKLIHLIENKKKDMLFSKETLDKETIEINH